MAGRVVLHGRFFGQADGWFEGRSYVKTLRAATREDVAEVLSEVEALSTQGLFCAGFVAYDSQPAALFHCFESFAATFDPFGTTVSAPKIWQSSVDKTRFLSDVLRIKEYLAAGDTYQVNYTFRLSSQETDATALMRRLIEAQPDCYGAFIAAEDFTVCSVSPELFLKIEGDRIESRPMKGTRKRGLSDETDEAQIEELRASEKDRAENLMIVDMVRNDLGRIAETGSVSVPELFAIETHKTLHQMTSLVTAKTNVILSDIFNASFPPASITGAPKVRTMEIIEELESTPRSVYTGAIGVYGQGRKGCFSVGIRTAVVNDKGANYGVGAGIVWDSDPESEWHECLLKSKVLGAIPSDTKLIETMRRTESGIDLIERHLARLSESANALGFSCDIDAVRCDLEQFSESLGAGTHKVRLLLSADGSTEVTSEAISEAQKTLKVGIKRNAVYSDDPLLRHKTTQRKVYEKALAEFPDLDEVILMNERGELTEGCMSNLLVKLNGQWYTPPVECGLLPGTLRQELIYTGEIQERVLTLIDLKAAEDIQLVNSVRGHQQVFIQARILL